MEVEQSFPENSCFLAYTLYCRISMENIVDQVQFERTNNRQAGISTTMSKISSWKLRPYIVADDNNENGANLIPFNQNKTGMDPFQNCCRT